MKCEAEINLSCRTHARWAAKTGIPKWRLVICIHRSFHQRNKWSQTRKSISKSVLQPSFRAVQIMAVTQRSLPFVSLIFGFLKSLLPRMCLACFSIRKSLILTCSFSWWVACLLDEITFMLISNRPFFSHDASVVCCFRVLNENISHFVCFF